MAGSLQDQLLKAGLADEKKLKQVSKEKRKQKKQQRNNRDATPDAVKVQARQALDEKARRSKELARQQNMEADKKAIAAQIRQLIEVNRLPRSEAEIPYNFADGKHIKKIVVTALMQQHLSNGRLAIVRLGDGYELVPGAVAEKIGQRDPLRVVLRNDPAPEQASEDDPYADYQIPDDLMW